MGYSVHILQQVWVKNAMTDEIIAQSIKNWIAKIAEHLKRAEVMLTFGDKAFDDAMAEIGLAPTSPFRFKFEPFVCIIKFAPIAKIQECLTGGGIVIVMIVGEVKWPVSQKVLEYTLKIIQVTDCNETEAKVIYFGGETDVLKDPKTTIVGGALLWVGG